MRTHGSVKLNLSIFLGVEVMVIINTDSFKPSLKRRCAMRAGFTTVL